MKTQKVTQIIVFTFFLSKPRLRPAITMLKKSAEKQTVPETCMCVCVFCKCVNIKKKYFFLHYSIYNISHVGNRTHECIRYLVSINDRTEWKCSKNIAQWPTLRNDSIVPRFYESLLKSVIIRHLWLAAGLRARVWYVPKKSSMIYRSILWTYIP